jgi:hypothetical protein
MFLRHALIQHCGSLGKNMPAPKFIREVYCGLKMGRGVDGVSVKLLLCSKVNGRSASPSPKSQRKRALGKEAHLRPFV